MTSTPWFKRWEWKFTRARDLNTPSVDWTGKSANRGETQCVLHWGGVLWIFREDRSRGRLQPINSHEPGLGTHLGPGRRWLAREKHKKRGQNEAHCIAKCYAVLQCELNEYCTHWLCASRAVAFLEENKCLPLLIYKRLLFAPGFL